MHVLNVMALQRAGNHQLMDSRIHLDVVMVEELLHSLDLVSWEMYFAFWILYLDSSCSLSVDISLFDF